MKKLFLQVLCLFVLTTAFFSCEKDDDKPSKTALLTSKTWYITKYEEAGVDVTNDYQDACSVDNTNKFNSDGSFTEYIGAVKCESSEKDSKGTWSFKTNETIFSIHYEGDDEYDWKLVELTATSFKISHVDDDTGLVLVITFKSK